MSYSPYPGGTLLIPSGAGSHLFVILTKACPANGHLLINVTSIDLTKHHDPTCVFAGGEHEFIKKPCYAIYSLARQVSGSTIIKCVGTGLYVPKDDLEAEHVQRICGGIENSRFSAKWLKDYYFDNRPWVRQV